MGSGHSRKHPLIFCKVWTLESKFKLVLTTILINSHDACGLRIKERKISNGTVRSAANDKDSKKEMILPGVAHLAKTSKKR